MIHVDESKIPMGVREGHPWSKKFPLKPWSKITPCTHSAHNPPKYMVYPEGDYIHKCPCCGQVSVVHTRKPTLS